MYNAVTNCKFGYVSLHKRSVNGYLHTIINQWSNTLAHDTKNYLGPSPKITSANAITKLNN